MKVKCAIFRAECNSMPTYADIDKAQPKGAKVIYGGGKRKTKSIPYIEKHHTIVHAFRKFETHISTKDEDVFYARELFLFQSGANEMLLRLRYTNEMIAVFEIDEKIIDEIHCAQWACEWIERKIKSLNNDIGDCKFFVEKKIGDSDLHKKFPAHVKSIKKMIADYEKAEKQIIKNGKDLFTSGW